MANGIEIASYDPKKVSVIINGKEITNFGPDSVISVTRNEDIVTTQVGVKGDVAYSENANESGNCAITLMGTSSSLPYLRRLAIKRTPISLMIRDANDIGAVNVAEDECRILKPPDLNRAKEVGSETINIFIPSLNYR